MKWSEQQELFQQMVNEEKKLLESKGAEYASAEDSLANFKTKLDIGVSPLQVIAIFMDKHYSSIKSFIRTGKEISDEPIEERIQDMRNYLFLLAALIKEKKDPNGNR